MIITQNSGLNYTDLNKQIFEFQIFASNFMQRYKIVQI